MTQLERVLEKARTIQGCCQADFAHPTCDGGPPITRVAARLQEAEDKLGATFECIGWRSKTKCFRLVDVDGSHGETPSAESETSPLLAPAAPVAAVNTGRLFDNIEVGKPQVDIYDPKAA